MFCNNLASYLMRARAYLNMGGKDVLPRKWKFACFFAVVQVVTTTLAVKMYANSVGCINAFARTSASLELPRTSQQSLRFVNSLVQLRSSGGSTGKLVYDIGLNDGTDTAIYLKQGYRVVAVDANPVQVGKAAGHFLGSVLNGSLQLINAGLIDDGSLVDGQDAGPTMDFFISDVQDDWSSFKREYACRPHWSRPTSNETTCHTITVPTTSCGVLVSKLGAPYYLKIDIEGHDMDCMASVAALGRAFMPAYASVEGPDREKIETFANMGYTRFKIQSMRQVVQKYYADNNVTALGAGGASGPFGEMAVDFEKGSGWNSKSEVLLATERAQSITDDWFDLHVGW